jgi:hypothetical protein
LWERIVKIERGSNPKTYSSFYKPRERFEARKRSDRTIIACIVVIVIVAIVRGL